MHRSISVCVAVLALDLLLMPQGAFAWSGDFWGDLSRATIKSNADLMIDSSWVAKNPFTNFQYGSTYQAYSKGLTYTGVPYSQDNPQENWPEFLNLVTNTAGGSVGYGNDCSGFASICWRLTARQTTSTFESRLGTYWVSLGDIGSAASVPLLTGDALNRASSHIILFLKYESGGIRSMEQTPDNAQRRLWSYSGLANYRPIRRVQLIESPTNDAPVISGDGVCRMVDAGKPVTLSVAASGPGTLTYQWRLNGTDLPGQTKSNLVLNAVQFTEAGDYVCVVGNGTLSATSKVMSVTVYPPETTIFVDRFDTDSSASWMLNRSSTDTQVTFAYDYSAMGIPAAPNSSGTTRGLKMEANMKAGTSAALSLSPRNRFFGGDYRLRFDMWINVNGPLPDGGTGSTEHLTAGIGTSGDRLEWAGAGSMADGYWFGVNGEGGSSESSSNIGDFCAYIGPVLQSPSTGFYTAGSDSAAKGNDHVYYTAAFPQQSAPPTLQKSLYPNQTGVLKPGTVGFAWRDVIVARRGDAIEWSIDGAKLASIPNATVTASNIFVGYWDYYASISDNANASFGLVDNVRVEVPTASIPRFVSCIVRNGSLQLEGTGTPGRYVIEGSADMKSWLEVTNVVAVGTSFQLSLPQGNEVRRFYRVRMVE